MFKLLLKILKDEQGTTLAVTYSFSPNTLIVSSNMNTNFDDIEAVVNALTASNYSADSVGAAALGSDVVRSGYGLIQHTDGSLYVDVSDTNPCLEITDGGLRAKVDDSSIERASGGLQVKALGITNAMLAGSIAAGKLAGSIGDSLLSQISTADKVGGSAVQLKSSGGLTNSTGLAVSAALGTWVDKTSSYGAQQAATDGFVLAYTAPLEDGFTIDGYTDSSADPTTKVASSKVRPYASTGTAYIMFPVKKSDYWKVVLTNVTIGKVYWIPLGV